MAKHFTTALLIMLSFVVTAQQNNDTALFMLRGSFIHVNPNTQLYLRASVYNQTNPFAFDAFPEGEFNNLDSIFINVNISNQINRPLFSTASHVHLFGNYQQFIRNDTVNFDYLWLNKSNQVITLERNVSVSSDLTFRAGSIDLVDYNLDLRNNGLLINERFNHKAYGDKGYVIARNRLVNPSRTGDVSSLGFSVTPAFDNLSLTQFYRRNDEQDSSSEGSISRFYDVITGNTGSADLVFEYFDLELNSSQEKRSLRLYASPDVLVDEARNFVKYVNTISDGTQNTVSGSGLTLLNTGNRWTLADTNCANPPTANLSQTPLRFCLGDSITLDAGTEAYQYLWFPTLDTNRNIVVKAQDLPANGKDTLSVVLVARNGCATSEKVVVEMYDNPIADFGFRPTYCEGELAVLDNRSSIASGASLTYQWILGDSSTTTAEDPQWVTAFGQGTTTLIAISPYGCTDTLTQNFFVSARPTASFISSASDVCPNEVVQFQNMSTIGNGAIAISQWSFGDGFNSTLVATDALNDELKAYQNGGSYTIRLRTTTNAGCADSAFATVNVRPRPTPNFSFTGFTAGQPVNFVNQSTISDNSALSYQWQFQGGSPTTATNPIFTFPSIGDYDVTLKAFSVLNCVDSITKTVVISGAPEANANFFRTDSCKGNSVQFINTSTVPGSDSLIYFWQFGDGSTSAAFEPTHTYLAAGTYTVRLRTTSAVTNLFDETTFTIAVYEIPVAQFSVADVCLGNSSVFTNTSQPKGSNPTYRWIIDGVLDTLTQQFSKTLSADTTYQVQLIATSPFGCADTNVQTTTVNPLPEPAFAGQSVCVNQPMFLIDSSTINSGIIFYNWQFGDGTTSNLSQPNKTYTQAGQYAITLNLTSDFGCTASLTESYKIGATPQAGFSYTLACNGDSTQFTNQSSIANDSLTYLWRFGAIDSSVAINPIIIFPGANSYSVQLVATSTIGCQASTTQLVSVNENPVAAFVLDTSCVGTLSTFVNASQGNNLSYRWTFGDGSQSFLPNPTKTYNTAGNFPISLTATSSAGCVDSYFDTLTIHDFPVVDFNTTGNCLTDSVQFSPLASVNSGSLTYTWNFNDGTTSSAATPKHRFTFAKTQFVSLTALSSFGCSTEVTKPVVINAVPVVNVSAVDSICVNSNFSPINTTSIRVGNTFSSQWTAAGLSSNLFQPTFNFTQATTTLVKYVATSGAGCKDSAVILVNVLPNPQVAFTIAAANAGDTTRFTNLSNQVAANFNWTFGDGASSNLVSPNHVYQSSGNYTISLTAASAFGCSATAMDTVFIDGPKYARFTAPDTICSNDSVSFVNESVYFGAAQIDYTWSFDDGDSSTAIEPTKAFASAGVYNIVLTASPNNGSAVSFTKQIVVNQAPNANIFAPAVCLGQQTSIGSLSASDVTYSWLFNAQTTIDDSLVFSASSLNPLSIVLTATANNGCSASATQVFTPVAPATNPFGDTLFTCLQADTLTLSNDYSQVNWNNGAGVGLAFEAVANISIQVSAKDQNGCNVTYQTFLTQSNGINVNLGVDSISVCGSVTLDAGASGNQYNWNTGATTRSIVVTQSGQYLVTVSESGLCEGSDTIQVNILPLPAIDLGADVAVCSDSNLIIGFSQGSTSLSFSWNTGATTSTIQPANSGNYALTVTDLNGCSNADTLSVTLFNLPVVNLGNDLSVCQSATPIVLSNTGSNGTFIWNTGANSSSLTTSTAGVYWLQVTNSNGCVNADTIALTVNANPTLSLATSFTVCADSVLLVQPVTNATSYSWSNGDTNATINVGNAGTYSLTVTDTLGCTANAATVVNHLALPVSALPTQFTICQDLTPFTINAGAGAAAYSWNNGATTASFATDSSFNYVVTITAANGCTQVDSVLLTVNTLPVVNLGADTSYCAGSTIVLDAQNPNASYLWSNGSINQTLSVSSTGIYSVQVTNSNGCTASDSRQVTVRLNPSVNLGPNQVICQGQTATLNAGSQNAYAWSNGQSTNPLVVSQSGNYAITVTAANGCTAVDSVSVALNATPQVSLGPDITACGSATIQAVTSSTALLWSTNQTSNSIMVNQSGVYTVRAGNANGCFGRDTISVNILALPAVELGNDTTICQGQFTTFGRVIPGAAYIWSNNSTQPAINVGQAGVYSLTVSGANQCVKSDTVELYVNPTPVVNLGADKQACNDIAQTIGVTPGADQYLWSNGATTALIQTLTAGNYSLSVTNAFGCQASDAINVSFYPYPQVSLGNDTTVCGSIQLNSDADTNAVLWSNGSATESIIVNQSGVYVASVSNFIGCTTSDTISVTILPLPNISLPAALSTCGNASVTLSPGGNALTYLWNTGDTSAQITVSDSGLFSVTAVNAIGCQKSDTVLVNLLDLPIVNLNDNYVLCQNEEVRLGAQNPGAVNQWFVNNQLISTQDSLTFSEDGTYWLTVANADNCTVTDTFRIQKTGNAIYADFLVLTDAFVGDTLKFVNLSYPAPYTSTWSFGDGIISAEQSPLHIYLFANRFNAKLTVTNGICTNSISKEITTNFKANSPILDSLPQQNNQEYILTARVFPNPTNGQFVLEAELAVEEDLYVDFFNMNGQLIEVRKYEGNKFLHQAYNFEGIPPGLYFLRMVVQNQSKIFKIVIQ